MSDEVNIGDHLRKLDLPFHELPDGICESAVKVTLPDAQELLFPVLLVPFVDDFGDAYVRLAIAPYLPAQTEVSAQLLAVGLARLNDRAMAVKFAVDEDGDWELVLDIVAEGLDATTLEAGLRRLALYAGACREEANALAGINTATET